MAVFISFYIYILYYIYMYVCVIGVYIYDIKKSKQDVAEHVSITFDPLWTQ